MNETEYHHLADAELAKLLEKLETIDQSGGLEVEYESGVMTIELPDGRQCVISKHLPTRQLWLSSPICGGLHFSHAAGGWALADGRTLSKILAQDLLALAQIKVDF